MQPYDDALAEILEHGVVKSNKRTGIKTRAIFGLQKRYNLKESFPIITRRKVWPESIFKELLWFISGSTNNNDLLAMGCKIWNPWVDPEFEKKHGYVAGSFGPVYGFQLRYFGGEYGNGDRTNPDYGRGGFDQLAHIIERIGQDPSDRRLLFSLWNPRETSKMKLPPCHYTYQVFIDDDGMLNGMLTQRSGDYPVGCCANVQFYSALTMMIAQQTGYTANEFIHSCADAHCYEDQIDAVREYLSRDPVPSPKLILHKAKDIFSYQMSDFELVGYNPLPKIEIPVAV
jgi:thymidylate synthase